MGVAALILGILSLILACIPGCNVIAFLPAIIGLILGIVDVVKKSKAGAKKGLGIAGIILTAIALIVAVVWSILGMAVIGAAANEIDSYSSSSYYDYY